MLWIMRNMPSSSATILERARRYYDDLSHDVSQGHDLDKALHFSDVG